MTACGGEEKPKAIEPSSEMRLFLQSLNGTSERVSLSLERWSDQKLVQEDDMRLYPLANPSLQRHTIGTKGDCYEFVAQAHDTRRSYQVCWKDKKITSVAFKGMK